MRIRFWLSPTVKPVRSILQFIPFTQIHFPDISWFVHPDFILLHSINQFFCSCHVLYTGACNVIRYLHSTSTTDEDPQSFYQSIHYNVSIVPTTNNHAMFLQFIILQQWDNIQQISSIEILRYKINIHISSV
jgi:hypothetical protein